jgi:hypothetical protein
MFSNLNFVSRAASHTPYYLHSSLPLTQHKKHDTTMASLLHISPSLITPPTDGRWPSNRFQPLPYTLAHQPIRRHLKCHSRFRVRRQGTSWTHRFTTFINSECCRSHAEAISPPICIKPLPLAFE